ncbi:tyrosine-protein phosphatase [Luteococcus peritonei]|uniref:Tyrosine-protein phosphatase n=1 Tax=Luteococcus peritonei TaxID=88874 RepID=A0ABW4RYQ2_9ACTN
MSELPEIRWIDLPGVVNMRDLGGKPAAGTTTRFGSVIRTDNLQDLPAASVRRLVDELGVTDVVDLRTDVERASTGDGPLAAEGVRFHTLSLYPEASMEHGIPDPDTDEPPTFPWKDDFAGAAKAKVGHETHLANHYFGYLEGRPDNIVAALRAIAAAPGAVLVHCAAGKDRTGTICALALTVAGADRDAVVADYDATNERVHLIFDRLANSDTYRADLEGQVVADQSTPAESMRMLLQVLDEQYGAGHANGVEGWLAGQGWTDEDSRRLRAKLLEPQA